jgi:DNA-binding NtrC family response regulator
MTFPVSEPHPDGSARCLVVDDEPGIRRALVRMFREQGFACLEASSGRQALDLLAGAGKIPLIVSDMRMPELDGMGLLSQVRQLHPDTAVILLSGATDTTTAVECLHLGAADFLVKPVSLTELQARVTRAREKRALVLQNRLYQSNLERRVRQQAARIHDRLESFLGGG